MNSYNENLHSSIVETFKVLQLELKKKKAQMEASIFSLYYTEGARITSKEKLIQTTDIYIAKKKVKGAVDSNKSITSNLLESVKQENSCVDQAVTNTAVAAANIQVAANAIVKLAADIGSIFSIVNTADYGTDIYAQAQYAHEIMNKTAYNAERTSQFAMEASALTAEVNASHVNHLAQTTLTSISDLQNVVSAELEDAAEVVETDTEKFENAFINVKKAKGILEDSNILLCSIEKAYEKTNKELNLALQVKTSCKNAEEFMVSFSPLTSAFAPPHNIKSSDESVQVIPAGYPVQDYYLLIVPNKKKSLFTNSDAEGLYPNKNQSIKIIPTEIDPALDCFKKRVSISDLLDSDGNPIKPGQDYVVFIFAKLQDEYKAILNSFEDYLSAPSNQFRLTNFLQVPTPKKIEIITESNGSQQMSFELEQLKGYKVEYRCMFLPDIIDLGEDLLYADPLRNIENIGEKSKKPGFIFNSQLAEQVTAANYTKADTNVIETKDYVSMAKGKAVIHPETTDNFGNRLIEGKSYIPVVLAISNEQENNVQYSNNLSNFGETNPFIYKDHITVKQS